MDVLMEINGNMLEGEMGKEFVRRGLCPELSLGYNVTMSKSPAGFYKATNKRVVELSIVRQGARDGCKIRAFADSSMKSADAALNSGLYGPGNSSSCVNNSSTKVKRHRILA